MTEDRNLLVSVNNHVEAIEKLFSDTEDKRHDSDNAELHDAIENLKRAIWLHLV